MYVRTNPSSWWPVCPATCPWAVAVVALIEEGLVVRRAKLAIRAGVRELPVELLGGDRHDEVGRRHRHLDLRPRGDAEEGQDDEDQRGRDGPRDLERRAAVGIARAPAG